MTNHIQTLLKSVTKKQAGLGAVAFCGGFGLGLYLKRRGEVEIVVEPDPEPFESELDLEEVAEQYQEALDDIFQGDYEAVGQIRVVEDEVGLVLSPPRNDPSMIAVDLEKLHHRDALIQEHGFTEGMRLYQEEYSMGTDSGDEEESNEEVISIFTSEDSEWDQEEEDRKRASENGPYVLHKDEFWADEKDYSQTTVTYYAGDGILCSEDDKPVYNHSDVIGELRFGHGSGDQNVFYVRNDKLRAEYEVIRDRGSYEIEVLGLEAEAQQDRAELKHSLRKFRPDD